VVSLEPSVGPGAQGIGALLIYRPDDDPGPPVEERLPTSAALQIRTAHHLAPLRPALAQVDGAAVLDTDGVLRQLGVRVVPSSGAEDNVEPSAARVTRRDAATATTTRRPLSSRSATRGR
jgi:hypothetical protein